MAQTHVTSYRHLVPEGAPDVIDLSMRVHPAMLTFPRQDDHAGTHMDATKHIVPNAPGPEGIALPIQWEGTTGAPVRAIAVLD